MRVVAPPERTDGESETVRVAMNEPARQCTPIVGAGFSGALSLLSAIGAGFLINDAILIPLYAGLAVLIASGVWNYRLLRIWVTAKRVP